MDQTKESHLSGNHPVSPLPLLFSSFSTRADRAAPRVPICSQQFRGIQCGMPETENLLPQTAPFPPPAELGSSGFPQPSTHPGPHGKRTAVLLPRALKLWQDMGLFSLPPLPPVPPLVPPLFCSQQIKRQGMFCDSSCQERQFFYLLHSIDFGLFLHSLSI